MWSATMYKLLLACVCIWFGLFWILIHILNAKPIIDSESTNKIQNKQLAREMQRIRERMDISQLEQFNIDCENVRHWSKNPNPNPSKPEEPFYSFRSEKMSGSIEYGGLVIYPNVPLVPKSQPPKFKLKSRGNSQSDKRLTVITHTSIDRLNRLLEMLKRINPLTMHISASIFVPLIMEEEFQPRKILAKLRETLQKSSVSEEQIKALSTHVVYIKERNLKMSTCASSDCVYYPINILRNIAINYVDTPWILSLDIDMMPSSKHDLERAMVVALDHDEQHGILQKRAWNFVVRTSKCPVAGSKFEDCRVMPSDKPSGYLIPDNPSQAINFRPNLNNPSNTSVWHAADAPYKTNYYLKAEPYFLTKVADFPLYDERFFYGDDKVSQVYEAASAGLEFYVLPRNVASLIHWDHTPAKFLDNSHEIARTKNPHKLLLQIIARSYCLNDLSEIAKNAHKKGANSFFICTTHAACASDYYHKVIRGDRSFALILQKFCNCPFRYSKWKTTNMWLKDRNMSFT